MKDKKISTREKFEEAQRMFVRKTTSDILKSILYLDYNMAC